MSTQLQAIRSKYILAAFCRALSVGGLVTMACVFQTWWAIVPAMLGCLLVVDV